jgi:hypothetical protein
LAHVSDQRLRGGLAELLASSYRTEARIVAHIAEVEERKLHSKDGSSSLFEYCVKQLGLSENEAFHRLTAARIARKFPVVFSLLERRELHLTAVCLLRDYLTPENHLVAAARHVASARGVGRPNQAPNSHLEASHEDPKETRAGSRGSQTRHFSK